MKQAKAEDVKVGAYIQNQRRICTALSIFKPNKKHAFCVHKRSKVILEIISISLQHTKPNAEKSGYNKRYRAYAAE